MKIYFERSGGFLGREVSTFVDTTELPPEKALRLLTIVEDTDFFTLSPPVVGSESLSASDQMCYRVTVEVAGVQHTIEASDTTTPPELEPLIEELSRWARQTERANSASDVF
ncbi:MAG: hypothetical protein IPH95_21660 [Candidatus Promineofilum sp.]|jgi:hypothetical protein|nr:hypothetical protein [Promineifilum sp.]